MKPLSFLRRNAGVLVPIIALSYLAWRLTKFTSPVVGVLLVGTGILIAIYLYQPAEKPGDDGTAENKPPKKS
jgi:hypothetical protein